MGQLLFFMICRILSITMQISEYLYFTYQFVAFFSGSKKIRIWYD